MSNGLGLSAASWVGRNLRKTVATENARGFLGLAIVAALMLGSAVLVMKQNKSAATPPSAAATQP